MRHLTEGRFRECREQTSGDERDRFRAVRRLLEEDLRVDKPQGPSRRVLAIAMRNILQVPFSQRLHSARLVVRSAPRHQRSGKFGADRLAHVVIANSFAV